MRTLSDGNPTYRKDCVSLWDWELVIERQVHISYIRQRREMVLFFW
jgi:hypothetical protein